MLTIFLVCCSPIEQEDDLFVAFWKTMDKDYVYFDEKNVNWDSVYSVYYPKTRNITENEYIKNFQEIVNLFKDGHLFLKIKDSIIYYNRPISTVDSFSLSFPNEYYSQPPHIYYENSELPIAIIQFTNNIIYIHAPTFVSRFDYYKFVTLLNTFSYSKGIILDLRANRGGMINNCINLTACFFEGTRTLLYEKHKIGAGHNDFSDLIAITADGWGFVDKSIPIVVLCGNSTYSAGNFCVGIMKYLPNVTVIGTTTGGGGSGRPGTYLPDGWILYYPYAPSYDIKMNSLEAGVEPHIKIEATKEQMQENPYIVSETAYNYLLSK